MDFTPERVVMSKTTKDSVVDWGTLKMRKINKTTTVIKGNFTVLKELNNDYVITTELLKWQGGEYRKTVIRIPTQKYCDFIQNDSFLMLEFINSSSATRDCPTPVVNLT